MSDPRLPVEILRQILDALGRIERRFSQITVPGIPKWLTGARR
jgi:hypothetical protein